MRPAPICLRAVLLVRPVGSHHPARYGVGVEAGRGAGFPGSAAWLMSPMATQSGPFVSVLGFFPAGAASLGWRDPDWRSASASSA